MIQIIKMEHNVLIQKVDILKMESVMVGIILQPCSEDK